jgi:hypothetical protein
MGDYLQSIIYKLYSPSHPDVEPYYGSSKNPLYKRRGSHKGDYKRGKSSTAFLILCYDDWVMEIVENYPCESAEQLRAREGWWISNHPCINQRNAGTGTGATWRNNNDMKEYHKNYYEENKEQLKQNSKKHYEENKEQHKIKAQEYERTHREQINAKKREWIANNREAYLSKKREAYKKRKEKQKDIWLSAEDDKD